MEGNLDKCLAFCQALVVSNHQFTFALTIGKDNTFSFSTYDQGRDLKKAAPRPQSRRERRAVDPAVKQKATAYKAKVAAEKVAAEKAAAGKAAPDAEQVTETAENAENAETVPETTDPPDMGGAAGPAPTAAEEAKREPCCRRCRQPVAGHPGGSRGCGTNCTNLALTPEKLRQASDQGDPSLATPGNGGREEQCQNCNIMMTEEHQCEESHETAESPTKVSPRRDSRAEEPAMTGNKLCRVCKKSYCTPENPNMGRCENRWANPL